MVNKVKIIQKCVIVSENKILVIRRSITDPSRPGTWDFPGGNVDDEDNIKFEGDILKKAIGREVEEEIGIKLSDSEFETIYVNSSYNKHENFLIIWIGYKSKTKIKQKVSLSEEHDSYKWVTYKEFIDLDFGYARDYFMGMLKSLDF